MSDLNSAWSWLAVLKGDKQLGTPSVARAPVGARLALSSAIKRRSLRETMSGGTAVYCSRSHRRLWRQGEESRHVQRGRSLRELCTGDVLLLSIDQAGGIACHTGRASCFFYQLQGDFWVATDPVLKDPEDIYGK